MLFYAHLSSRLSIINMTSICEQENKSLVAERYTQTDMDNFIFQFFISNKLARVEIDDFSTLGFTCRFIELALTGSLLHVLGTVLRLPTLPPRG
jgi:hypothetical protein